MYYISAGRVCGTRTGMIMMREKDNDEDDEDEDDKDNKDTG